MGSTKFVGRGGEKLEGALEYFGIDVTRKICLDVGASTGGFTDCLLQRGAAKVWAVDTAYGELAWGLRQNGKVIVKEKTNILHDQDKLTEIEGKIDLVTVDAGWTRAELVVSAVVRYLKPDGIIILLIKPQYEQMVGDRDRVRERKKVILEVETARAVSEMVRDNLIALGFKASELLPSTIKGDSGNQEYLVVVKRSRP